MPDGAQVREHIKQNLTVEVLRRTGQVRLAAFGYSMLPSLWPGNLLTIEARPLDQVGIGDIVLYLRSDRFFVHRVVEIESSVPPRIRTRGDAMPVADPPVSCDELMGVVTGVRGVDGRSVPVPASSRVRRLVGLALTYSAKLRSLALRVHGAALLRTQ